MTFFYSLLLVVGLFLVIPRIVVAWEKMRYQAILKNLDPENYLLIRDIKLPNGGVDYLIVSRQGVFAIKECVFGKRNSFIIGDEAKKVWHYYEPYVTHILAPRGQHGEAPTANANKYAFDNPVIQCEEALKVIQSKLSDYPQLKFYPVVVLVPKIKGVKIQRKKNSRATIVFGHDLLKTLQSKQEISGSEDLNEIHNRLLQVIEEVTHKEKFAS